MKKRIELFNGYVKEPIPIVVLSAIVGIVLLVFSIWATYDLFLPSSHTSSSCVDVFVSYRHDGPIIRISSKDGFTYDIPTDAIDDMSLLSDLVNYKTPVVIEYSIETDSNAMCFDVVSLSSVDGVLLISETQVMQSRIDNARSSLFILWFVCIGYFAFTLSAYYFVSNAPRYPFIASLLIRAPYRNF